MSNEKETCGCPDPDIHSRQMYTSSTKGMQKGSAWCRNCDVSWAWSEKEKKWVKNERYKKACSGTETQLETSMEDVLQKNQ